MTTSTTVTSITKMAVFATVLLTLLVAHQVADHWLQTEHQAHTKGHPGWAGRLACASHVATYTLTAALALAAVTAGLHVPLHAGQAAAALTVSGITHYIADRRRPLQRLAELAGHASFWQLGAPRPDRDDNPSLGTGAYAMDQSWHWLWIGAAAFTAAVL